MTGRVYVITGSNKGIGLATVRTLCQTLDPADVVYLTARSVERGTHAVKELEGQGLKPKFHPLDVDDASSIEAFAQFLKTEHGGLDVLVNNAAMAYKSAATESFGEQAVNTIRVNYFGLKAVCKALFPLLRSHARVVNVSSCFGFLKHVPGSDLRKKLSSDSLTEEELDQMINDFVKAAADESHKQLGWPNTTYGVSKVGVSALTRIQQRQFDQDSSREDIIINHVHPGIVDTDMTSHKGIFTTEQGAVSSVYAATLPKNAPSPKGQFIWHDTQIVDWVNGPLPDPGY